MPTSLHLQLHLLHSPNSAKFVKWFSYSQRKMNVLCMSQALREDDIRIEAAPILLLEGPWNQIPGGVTATKGFKAAGMYGGLREGNKPDLALVTCDVDAISAGAFTTNVVAATMILYCKKNLESTKTVPSYEEGIKDGNEATYLKKHMVERIRLQLR